jgi:hypothetical protein
METMPTSWIIFGKYEAKKTFASNFYRAKYFPELYSCKTSSSVRAEDIRA